MDKKMLYELVDKLDENQIEMVYELIFSAILSTTEETEPLPDEIEAIERTKNDEIVSADEINW